MNAVIYARYSSHNQNEQSIDGQLRDCNAYAQEHGYTIVETYIDRAQTGRNDNRADFQRMLKDSDKHRFEICIVWKLDRFGRNREEIAFNKIRLRKNGVRLLYAKEGIPDAPEGIILESVLEGLAEYYSANLAQNIMRGMRESALKCQSTGSGRSLGYDVNKQKQFVVNEAEAQIVKKAFELYDGGDSLSDVARQLNAKGYRSARNGSFNCQSVKKILTNERYIGVYRWNDIVVPDGMPRIIEQELWDRVQRKIKSAGTKKRAPKEAVDFLLTGKIYCGECSSSMQGDSGTSKSGATHYYYSCHGRKHRKNGCKKKSVGKDFIERLIVEKTMSYVLTDEFIAVISERLEALQKAELKGNETISYYQSKLATAVTSLKNILKAIEAGVINSTIQERMKELEAERDEAKANIEREKVAHTIVPKEVIAYGLSKYKSGDVDDEKYRRWIIDALVHKVVLYDDRMLITFNFSGDGSELTITEIEEASTGACNYEDLCSTSDVAGSPKKKRGMWHD